MKIASILLLVFFIVGCYGKKTEVMKTGLEGKPMPAIDLLAADSLTYFNTEKIIPGKPVILFAFEPWCPYCKAQLKSIISHIQTLKDVDIYMVCHGKYLDFKNFYKKFELDKYENIKAGMDFKYSFVKYFKTNQIPFLAIYDRNKKLKQVLFGKNYISTIKKVALN